MSNFAMEVTTNVISGVAICLSVYALVTTYRTSKRNKRRK